ncbi:MAG: hypothetical protein AAGI38_15950 [Bacteroidota bacterium]
MIRLFIDKLGTGHQDVFLKIDAMPSCLRIADSYYLPDFLEMDVSAIEQQNNTSSVLAMGATQLIDYWMESIRTTPNGQEVFVPFDLSDEYLAGLIIRRTKLGYKVRMASTNQIRGYNVSRSTLDKQIRLHATSFENEDNEWLISEKALLEGLEWSKAELT